MTVKERFWSKVDIKGPDECWNWIAFVYGGYGKLRVGDKKLAAHRISWELHNGSIPKGLNVLHECDNRSCVNPKHLFLGTQKDNVDDMVKKKRDNKAKGEDQGHSKLVEKEVLEIRHLYSLKNTSYRKLAKLFNVSINTVNSLVNRRTWKHI